MVTLLVTTNQLRFHADTLERLPACGFEEHVHEEACFDAFGSCVCGLEEHFHTDACFQERPHAVECDLEDAGEEEPTEVELTDAAVEELGEVDYESDDEMWIEASEPAADGVLFTEEAEDREYVYDFNGESHARLSEVLGRVSLDVDVADIDSVGESILDDSQALSVFVVAQDGDYEIIPMRCFIDDDRVDLAVFTRDGGWVIQLQNGIEPIYSLETETTPEPTEVAGETDAEDAGGAPSVEPVVEPVVEETEISAAEPTEAPEVELTEEPLVESTEAPEAEATEPPVAESTGAPAVEATEEPSVESTEEPEAEPSNEPASEPTEEPEPMPTVEPTEEPEAEPTVEPTEEPEAEPTDEPTPEPTEEPEAEPFVEPSAEPTDAPDEAAVEAAEPRVHTMDIDVSGMPAPFSLNALMGLALDEVGATDAAEAAEETPAEAEAIAPPAPVFEAEAGDFEASYTPVSEEIDEILLLDDDEAGAFPEGTGMTVTPVEDEDTLSDIASTVESETVAVRCVHAVDIAFADADGSEIEPLRPIAVALSVEEIEEAQSTVVVHVDDQGAAELVEHVETGTEDAAPEELPEVFADAVDDETPGETTVAFESDAFSVYALLVTETIETRYISADGLTWTIRVSYGPEAGIPEGAALRVSEIEPSTDRWFGCCADAVRAMDAPSAIEFARFFDIEIWADEQKIEPAAPVDVTIAYEDAVDVPDDARLAVVHFADAGTEVITDVAVNDARTEFSYRQESFSVTGTIVTSPQPDTTMDTQNDLSGNQFALIVKYDNDYYIVMNDGTLEKTVSYNVENNTLSTVEIKQAMLWTYCQQDGKTYIRHTTDSWNYGIGDLAVANTGVMFEYIDPTSDTGLSRDRGEKAVTGYRMENGEVLSGEDQEGGHRGHIDSAGWGGVRPVWTVLRG